MIAILRLCKLCEMQKKMLSDLVSEIRQFDNKIYPKIIREINIDDITSTISLLQTENEETLFVLDDQKEKFIGVINIRYKLKDIMAEYVGNIGHCVTPSERRKGYGNEILQLAIAHAKRNGLNRILLTCDKTNIASKKCILYNGGVWDRDVIFKNNIIERYWIP